MKKFLYQNVEKNYFKKIINGKKFNCYSVFYPVKNGNFNIDKSIEDFLYIKESNKNLEIKK